MAPWRGRPWSPPAAAKPVAELAAAHQATIPQARIVQFPAEETLGRLRVSDWDAMAYRPFAEAVEARGEIAVPAGKKLGLLARAEAFRDGFTLAALAPDALHHLVLTGPEITDATLRPVGNWTLIQSLFLMDSAVTDAGLSALVALPRLRVLRLEGRSFTDGAVLYLRRLDPLDRLQLRGTRLTAEGVAALRRALPGCRITHDLPTPARAAAWPAQPIS